MKQKDPRKRILRDSITGQFSKPKLTLLHLLRQIIGKVQARDMIAFFVLGGCFALKFTGANGSVSVTMAVIVGYYFSKRVYEEKNR